MKDGQFNIDTLISYLEVIINKAKNVGGKLLDSETFGNVQEFGTVIGEEASTAIKGLRAIGQVASIPTKLYMRKFEKYCRGVVDIPIEKRQKYMRRLGKEKFNKEGVFILNVLNRIEDEDKIPFFLKLLSAKMDEIIDDATYRRYMIIVDRTLYNDLLYLKDNITEEAVRLCSASDYGLLSVGLLAFAGIAILDAHSAADDDGLRFSYTPSAFRIAQILFA